MLLTRDFDGRYFSLAPGEKTKTMFYADDRVFGWIYSGQVRIAIDGQQPFTATKGLARFSAATSGFSSAACETKVTAVFRPPAKLPNMGR